MGYNERHNWRLWIGLSVMVLLSMTSSHAQCMVGGTEFETSKTLCNPQLSNDEDGWFNEDVDKLLATETKGCDYYEVIGNAIQTGMPSNTIETQSSLFTTKGWADLLKQNGYLATNPGGFTAITANPKLIDPLLSEGNGTNMLVNAGTAHDKGYFMAYTVNGLKPNSQVTLTMDVYYLIDEASMKASLVASGENAISIFGGSVQYRSSGSQMPAAGLKISTTLDANLSPATTTTTTIAAKKGAQKVTVKGTSNSVGTVTFYVARTNPNALPIGIDNIEITGSIQPVITSAKMMPVCPENPVMLYLKHTYPEGTTYSWSMQGSTETSSTQSFSVTPKEANKTYKVTCTVTPPGCSATSASFTIETKTCCTMKDASGNELPMAETNIFYDDFGTFPDNRTYEYRDAKGVVHTVPVDGGLWTDVDRPFSVQFQPGSDIKGKKYPGSGDITTCITNVNPYTPGINGDASGTGRGGMLIFDVDKSFGLSTGLANKVLYEREICGLCKGKEITFSASFGAVNNNTSGVGEMAIVLRKGSATGDDLLEGKGKSGMLYGSEGWRTVEQRFTVPDNSIDCVVLQVVNITDSYGNSQGDFAIDDIVFTVCTPPDVAVDAVLSGHAKDLLDLCVDDILTLEAEISDVAKQFYGANIGYLFQYAYQDPTIVDDDKIQWFDLSSIQTSGEFVIKDPATHPAFAKIQDGEVLNVYFRVVIGDASYLSNERSEWEKMSALSPCRAISISSIPIVAGLNCAKCSELDETRTFTADKGRLKGKELRLCKEDGAATIGLKDLVHGIDKDGNDYYDYDVAWYKDDVKTANQIDKKKCNVDDHAAPEIKVNWSDVEEEGTKYIISFHDYFDPAMSTTPCDLTDTIIVYADPAPKKTLTDPDPFCEGTLSVEPDKTISGYKLKWYKDADTLTPMTIVPTVASTSALESPSTSYYVLIDAITGCRGEANAYTITVNPIPEEDLSLIPDFCQGDETAKLPASTSYEVNWYKDANATVPAVTDLSTLEGQITPYAYYYTLTNRVKTPNCTSKPVEYKFTVKPTASVTVTVTPACDETSITTQTVPANATVNWTIDGTTTVSDASSITVDNVTYKAGQYEAIASADGYCDSKPDAKTVTFNSTPAPITVSIDEYLKADGTPDYSKIDAKVTALKDADPYVSIYWSGVIGSTKEDQSSSMTAPASGYSTTRANPNPDLSSTEDEFFYYWIYQELKNSEVTCPSETTIVVVPILGAPAPIVHDTIYCLNSPNVATLSENVKINQAKQGVTYELVWKDGVDETTVPPVNAVGKFTYEVAQRDKNNPGNVSAYRKITVDVRGVKVPDVSGNKLAYCAEDVAQTLSVTKVDDNANNYYAAGFEWFLNGSLQTATPTPNTSVSTTTTYHYGVRQTYTVPTSGEVCYGDTATFDVKVTFVPQLQTAQVTYLKAKANAAGSFDLNLKQQESSVYSGEDANSTINWYASDGVSCSTPLVGTPTPKVDPSVPSGKDQIEYYCVSQTVDNCEGKTNIVKVVISDAPNPIVQPVSYCEGESTNPLTAQVNELTNPASAYQLIWYDENHVKITDGPTGPTPTAAMRSGETLTSTYKYYVTQKLTSTGAESTESEIVVTIYANPVLSIANPPAVCETAVNLASAVTLTNEVAGMVYVPTYFEDANGTSSLPSSSVLTSGVYGVQYAYNANVNSGVQCKSTIQPITVTIDTLNVLVDNVTTCPDMSAKFTSEVKTNASSVTYAWSGNGDSGNTPEFETKKFVGGNYGDHYPYSLTVTAGTCGETLSLEVVLGQGPVVGSLTIADPTNTEQPTKVYTNSLTSEEYYYCGGNVTITPAYDGDGDYLLTTPSGATSSASPFTVSGAGVYTLAYTNGCPTSVTFKLTDAQIALTNSTPSLEMCEGDKFTSSVTVTPTSGPDYSLVWKKDNQDIAGETSLSYTINATVAENSGLYTVEANRKGCVAVTEIGQLKVVPTINVTLPAEQVICEGEEAELVITNITPEGTTIEWQSDKTILTATDNESVTVRPTFKSGNGHQSTYTYVVNANNSGCKKTYQVTIKVDEPLKGKLAGETPICEGASSTISAESYDAATYTWSLNGMPVALSATTTVTPAETSTYKVDMTRGVCTASDEIQIMVTTHPVILSMDSVGIRDRQIVMDPNRGTGVFTYWVDGDVNHSTTNTLIKDLTFSSHIINVVDENGCGSFFRFVLDAPEIYIPPYFSPNGDGINDHWIIGKLAEVYPGAVVNIYDRYGKLIVQYLGDNSEGWDGTYEGQPLPSTDYWYMVDIEEIEKQYSGHFTLMRR